MPRLSNLLLAVVCAVAVFSPTVMADPTLKIGDPAPALAVSKFVQGEPVKEFEKGRIYVVEFWATWCLPCRESIPHLTEMQKTYPDVTFIGSDVGEDEATVVKFMKKMGVKMKYRVAIDDMSKEHGANDSNYMDAAEQKGIPTAFVIDKDSKIAWIGHPMELEPVLKQVVAGTFDEKKAAIEIAATDKVTGLMDSNDFDGAMKVAQETIAANPDLAEKMGELEFEILLDGKKDPVTAAKKAEELMPKIDDAETLNEFAWSLATAKKTTPETLATAQKLAEASLEKKKDEPSYLDTLARVYAVKKDFKKAVELEQKAIARNTNDELKESLDESLEAYKSETVPEK